MRCTEYDSVKDIPLYLIGIHLPASLGLPADRCFSLMRIIGANGESVVVGPR